MTIRRWTTVVIGVVFVTLIGFVVLSRTTGGTDRASEAPTALASEAPVGGEPEPESVSGRVGRTIAGFVLLGGWIAGMAATIVRAQRRRRSVDEAEGPGEQGE